MPTQTYNHVQHQTEIITHRKPGECFSVPHFRRLKYFFGQMLGALDFQAEQNFFREKMKLHNRCLHGYGTVCGLEVVPAPHDEDCRPTSEKEREELEKELEEIRRKLDQQRQDTSTQATTQREELHAKAEELRQKIEKLPPEKCKQEKAITVGILCGFALDCQGNELIVRETLSIDLWKELNKTDRKTIQDAFDASQAQYDRPRFKLYISICYCEQPIEPSRPIVSDVCGASADCMYGKIRDAIRIRVTLESPEEDRRCDMCCEGCADPCLLLARIDNFWPGQHVRPEDIHNEVRRHVFTPYTATTITGINWVHGATYKKKMAHQILGTHEEEGGGTATTGGIVVQFSQEVLSSTLQNGVVDMWLLELGKGRRGTFKHLEGDFMDQPLPPLVKSFRFRQTDRESLNYGDRILIMIRTAFILDKCCRPVDGTHVGGRVPLIKNVEPPLEIWSKPAIETCVYPAPGYGPWTSGNAATGGTFESWFYVREE